MTIQDSHAISLRLESPRTTTSYARRLPFWRSALWTLAFVLGAVLLLAMSALVHLSGDLGREAARDVLASVLSSRIRGTVSVGAIDRLAFDNVELRNFAVTAPNGEPSIVVDRIHIEMSIARIWREGRLGPARFDGGTFRVTARAPRSQVDLVYAMEVPDDRWTLPVVVDGIRLHGMTMAVDLPGKPTLTMRDVSGLASMRVGHHFVCQMDRVTGYVDLGHLHVGFRDMNGRLESDHDHPLIVRLVLNLEIVHPGVRLDYAVPALAGRPGHASFGLDLDDTVLSANP